MKNDEIGGLVFEKSTVFFLLLSLLILVGCDQKSSKKPLGGSNSKAALQQLLEGNRRFSSLSPVHPHVTIEQIQNAAKDQHPFAVIVACSDSRVSPELIFDEGIGDLFVIRTAGNIISGLEIGSVEYAVEHLGVKLVVVIGHENCGAVKAFIDGGDMPGHIGDIVESIKLEAEVKAIPVGDANRLDKCVVANVKHGIKQLLQSDIINEKIKNGQVLIIGMRYDLDDLNVRIIKE